MWPSMAKSSSTRNIHSPLSSLVHGCHLDSHHLQLLTFYQFSWFHSCNLTLRFYALSSQVGSSFRTILFLCGLSIEPRSQWQTLRHHFSSCHMSNFFPYRSSSCFSSFEMAFEIQSFFWTPDCLDYWNGTRSFVGT